MKGTEPISRSKVRKREKVGKSPVHRDHTISHSEEIPWIAQGDTTPIPEGIWKSLLSLSKDQRPAGNTEWCSSAGSQVHTEGRKPLNFLL